SPQNKKGHHRLEVMALWVASRVVGLHHPVRVGRLMPTLIKPRVRASRNIVPPLCHDWPRAEKRPSPVRLSLSDAPGATCEAKGGWHLCRKGASHLFARPKKVLPCEPPAAWGSWPPWQPRRRSRRPPGPSRCTRVSASRFRCITRAPA